MYFFGAATKRGSQPPHSRYFQITTTHHIRWDSSERVAETST